MGWDKSGTDPLKWAAKMKDAPRDAVNIFAFEVFKRVVERTPVDTGAARQNWLVTINNQTEEFDETKKKGGRVMSDGAKQIESAKGDDTIYIQNNVPYIRKLEYGGYGKEIKLFEEMVFKASNTYYNEEGGKTINGFSKQAPRGMVGATLAKADALWERAVAAAKEDK